MFPHHMALFRNMKVIQEKYQLSVIACRVTRMIQTDSIQWELRKGISMSLTIINTIVLLVT